LEVSGENQAETDSYFNTTKYRFHGPDGFEADYSGLTNYFKAIRAAFDDRSIRRGVIIAEGNYIACQNMDRGRICPRVHTITGGSFASERPTRRLGPPEHLPVRRSGAARRGVGTDRLQKFSASARSRRKVVSYCDAGSEERLGCHRSQSCPRGGVT
jgi:hypothetical protein